MTSTAPATWFDAGLFDSYTVASEARLRGQKHGVEPSEVESLFHRSAVLAGRILEPEHDESRWLLLGETDTGRRLALIFTRRDEKLRPITCRAMRRSERRFYDEAKASIEVD